MEPHGATVYTSNTTGAIWKSFKLGLEMHGAAWNRMEPPCKLQILQEPYGDFLKLGPEMHGAAWSSMQPHGAIV